MLGKKPCSIDFTWLGEAERERQPPQNTERRAAPHENPREVPNKTFHPSLPAYSGSQSLDIEAPSGNFLRAPGSCKGLFAPKV